MFEEEFKLIIVLFLSCMGEVDFLYNFMSSFFLVLPNTNTQGREPKSFQKFHHVIVMREGRIVEQGSYDELINNGGVFCDLLEAA